MGWYWDDFTIGDVFDTPGRTITETDVITFSQISGDQNEIHTNLEFCRARGLPGLLPQTNLVIAVASGLIARLGFFGDHAVGLVGLEWTQHQPIAVGDTVRCRVHIARLEPRGADTGFLRRDVEVLNQGGDLVHSGAHDLIMRRRSTDSP